MFGRYVVAGSSGKVGPMQAVPHPSMASSLQVLGSLVLDVTTGPSPSLTGTFITSTGSVQDRFVMAKRGDVTPAPRPPCV